MDPSEPWTAAAGVATAVAGAGSLLLMVHVLWAWHRYGGFVTAWRKSVARNGSFTASWVHAWAMLSLSSKQQEPGVSAKEIQHHTNQLYGEH